MTRSVQDRPLGHEAPRMVIALSALAFVGWLSFVFLYDSYWSGGFTLYQRAIMVILTLLIAVVLLDLTERAWHGVRARNGKQGDAGAATR